MGKLPGYTGSIDLISGIRQKNSGTFALAEANAIQTRDDGTRLDAELEEIKSSITNIAIPTASDAAPKASGTASAGTGTKWSREDHVHPIQTSVSGNAGTATKLANSRTLNISGVTATGASFDGSDDATIEITQIPAAIINGLAAVATSGAYSDLSGIPTLATVATSGKYSDLSGLPSIPNASSATPKAAGTASAGSGTTWSRADHVHPLQTSVSGNAGSADKLSTARTIKISGAINSSASFDGSDDIELSVASVDGTKITGTIPLSSIPKGAQERFVPVTDDTARLALTSDDVQNGDVVKVEDGGIMYYIVDDTKLGTEDAFAVFTAGAASSVAWSGITGKPTFATVATSGSYNDLSNTPTFAAVATSGKYSDLSGTPTLAIVATSGKYSDLSGTPSIPTASDATPKAASGSGASGSGTSWARADHVHPVQTTITGNAGSADKATNDAKDQQIDATYIKSLSANGKVITITKGDGTTSTISTQDTVNNVFGKVVAGGSTIAADAAVDTLTIEAGDNINIAADTTTDTVTISADNPSTTYNATIGTEWTGDAAPYSQVVAVTGITENDTPIVDIVPNNADYDALTTQLEEFGNVYRITTAANSITIYSTEKTTVEIPIQLKCVK